MSLQLAVAPTNPVPFLHLVVDLLAGNSSPGSSSFRALIVGPKNTSGGDMTADTEVREVLTEAAIKTAAGAGSLPHLAWKAIYAHDRTAQVDLVCPAESGGAAATGTITVSGTITTDGNIRCVVMGRVIDVAWLVGETPDQWKAKGISEINAYASDLFVTASDGGVGVITLTAKGKGPAGNDVTLRAFKTTGAASGTVTASGANLTGGTTEPVFTTALASAAGREYDFIVLCCSNADVNAASSNNPEKLETHITGHDSGINAKLQQGVYGSTGTLAAAATGAAGRNSEYLEHLCLVNGESLPCEVGGAELGDRMYQRKIRGNANRIGTKLTGLYGSADIVSDNPTEPELIAALNSGVTPFAYNANDDLYVVRPITTHSQDDDGNQDRRVFDCNEVDAMFDWAKGIRTTLPQEFFQAKIAKDRVEGDEDLPEGVVEERDVKGFIVSQTKEFWVPKGYIDGVAFDAAVESGELAVQVNDTDSTQVDIYLPGVPYKNLAKLGVFVAKVG